ncbi:MAG: PhoU domain-containing protein, partial [Acidimicrobiales bacterium]
MRRVFGSGSSHKGSAAMAVEAGAQGVSAAGDPATPPPGAASPTTAGGEELRLRRPRDATGEQIDRRLIQMFALVEEAVAGATHALLAGDREAARALVASDAALDDIYLELDALVQDRVVE